MYISRPKVEARESPCAVYARGTPLTTSHYIEGRPLGILQYRCAEGLSHGEPDHPGGPDEGDSALPGPP